MVLQMNTDFFKTYDIRAIVDASFNAATYRDLGHAFVLWLKTQKSLSTSNSPWVAVGYDARLHSPELYSVLVESLLNAGVSVVKLGMVPSPLVYFVEHYQSCDSALPEIVASLVVTASHNPAEYNGVKFSYQGLSITRENLQEIRDCYLKVSGSTPTAIFKADAETQEYNVIDAYRKWCQTQFAAFKTKPKVVIDCGNATAGVIAPAIFKDSGCDVVSLFEEPDGRFPNHHPDPCVHANLEALKKAVKREKADFGIAFDGDSDRLGVVDNEGNIIPGDMLLLLLAQEMIRECRQSNSELPIVVSEVKCSQHLFAEIEHMGATSIMSPTGHAFIKQRMRKENALLGGELSGHIFFLDKHWGFDDALYAALRLTQLIDHAKQKSPKAKLSGLMALLPKSYLSEEHRVHVEKIAQPMVLSNLLAYANEMDEFAGLPVIGVQTVDGIRVNLEGGFWLVRASNTEPCLTIRMEAPSQDSLDLLERQVLTLVTKFVESQDVVAFRHCETV